VIGMVSKFEMRVIEEYLRNETRLDGREIERFSREIKERLKSAKKMLTA